MILCKIYKQYNIYIYICKQHYITTSYAFPKRVKTIIPIYKINNDDIKHLRHTVIYACRHLYIDDLKSLYFIYRTQDISVPVIPLQEPQEAFATQEDK